MIFNYITLGIIATFDDVFSSSINQKKFANLLAKIKYLLLITEEAEVLRVKNLKMLIAKLIRLAK